MNVEQSLTQIINLVRAWAKRIASLGLAVFVLLVVARLFGLPTYVSIPAIASFGRALETPAVRGVNLIGIPCSTWNCEDSSWEGFDPERTRIVHVKSALRRAIFDGARDDLAKPGVARLAEMWTGIEAGVLEVA